MPSAPPAPSSTSELSAGRYLRRSILARGGMGTVFLAHDQIARRDVAFKSMALPAAGERASRTVLFRREYDTLAQLPHPNIVEVYDYGEEGGEPYYVMELLSGADLATAAPLPFREACRVLRDIASALALVHARRLIHRDVSPNNVRLGASGVAKLIDFGALSPFGRAQELVGTPGFIAPECLDAVPLGPRSDLYSLGVLAYWTLARRLPYAASTLEELADAMRLPPLPPSAYVPDLPRPLDELVLSLLAHDPDARPTSAAYVIDRLTTIADLPPERDERRVAESYLARPPLCGRKAALDTLIRAVEYARGPGRNVLVEGESGLGRSALLDAAALHAQLQGFTVLRTQGASLAAPFGTVRTLIRAASTFYPDLAPPTELVASMAPSPTSARATTLELAERHAAVFESARAIFLELGRRRPLVVIVDDLHLCDRESLALLVSLAREEGREHISLLSSSLTGRLPSDFTAYARRASHGEHVVLSPLTVEEVGELVQAIFGAVPNSLRLARWLHVQAGGNPANTLELIRLLLKRGLIRYTLGTFTLPQDIESALPHVDLGAAVLARLDQLDPKAETLARMLSLHLEPLPLAVLAAAAELEANEALLTLEELTQRGVVGHGEAGFYIVGSTLRGALQQATAGELRERLHLALARALLDTSRSRSELRYDACLHLLRGGHADEAIDLAAGRAHAELFQESAARCAPMLEEVLAAARAQGRSKEACVSLVLPAAAQGFYGSYQVHARNIDQALAWLSEVCGLSLARRLGRYVGGKLGLLFGMLYAAGRRAFVPKRERLGSLSFMISYLVALVCDAVAAAVVRGDAVACARFVGWLEPLGVLPPRSPGWLLREFCLATLESARGRTDVAAPRYERLISLLAVPVPGLQHAQQSIYLGAINGQGMAEAVMGNLRALSLAEQLDADAFFSSHGEIIRSTYHALRGDRDNAELHRERAEQLALRGGASSGPSTLLTVTTTFTASIGEDAIGLVRVIAELESLSAALPRLHACKVMCEAWLWHLRGRSERARELYEQVIDLEEARALPTVMVNRACYAAVLNALAEYESARVVCERELSAPERVDERTVGARWLKRELSVALAGLGRVAEASALCEAQIEESTPVGNPLELGAGHRYRARIALFARDRDAFEAHYQAMERYYRETRNPCLIQQLDGLVALAEQAGMRQAAPKPRVRASEPLEDFEGETYVETTTRRSIPS